MYYYYSEIIVYSRTSREDNGKLQYSVLVVHYTRVQIIVQYNSIIQNSAVLKVLSLLCLKKRLKTLQFIYDSILSHVDMTCSHVY